MHVIELQKEGSKKVRGTIIIRIGLVNLLLNIRTLEHKKIFNFRLSNTVVTTIEQPGMMIL